MSGRRPAADARLTVDWTACEGRGVCAELLPEVLTTDPWGYPLPAGPGPDGTPRPWPRRDGLPVAPASVADARRAVRMCPRLALRLEEDARRRA
ncbi:ferredoxin [uncultured Pseudokineococcus sp.]|uniref:ferredoxin n=1 Tax=uncultured Pseudokineococcus sp. TaxID=1642928 RepID=UPI002608810A|nr:ferredoxin [uncultured Pseudokineococcus sp.]